LVRDPRARKAERLAVLEGYKQVLELLEDPKVATRVLYVEQRLDSAHLERLERAAARSQAELVLLAPGALDEVLESRTPQGVAALVERPEAEVADVVASKGLVVVCVAVQDPGNVGTVVRSARAFGASGVVLAGPCADPWSPKALRASAGAALGLAVSCAASAQEVLEVLGQAGFRRLGAVARGGEAPTATNLASPCALVLGSEGQGLDLGNLGGLIDATVTVRTATESLNVAMAATLLCYEASRFSGYEPGPERSGSSGLETRGGAL